MNLEQFKLWLRPGVLGFYRSCEATVCGLIDHSDTARNLFTILTFEDKNISVPTKPTYLTQKNECFGDRFRLFVAQYNISLDTATYLFQQIAEGNRQIDTPFGRLDAAPLTPVPPYFVPNDSTATIPANRFLKNNFNGSMVSEWFGNQDVALGLLKEADFQKVTLRIRELLPIDLFTLSDHIGNVLFQFPQQIAFCKLSGAESAVTCSIVFSDRVLSPETYSLSVFSQYDETLMDFHMAKGQADHQLELTLPNTGGPYVITLTDTEYGIPVLQQTTSLMRQFHGVLHLQGDADCIRTITMPNREAEKIQVDLVESISTGRPAYLWERAARQRQYQRRMDELAQRLEFVRYGRYGDERAKALKDLRKLLGSDPLARVCLWDPYLTAVDLLETWYFTDTYGLELRAITSNIIQQKAKPKQTLDDWKAAQREILSNGSNQYGINLRWRVQHSNFGFSFHDRFLILIPKDLPPKVWSLGTSVNSFGKTHHILQSVSNPGYIVEDFEELWAALEDASCQIWNSKEDTRHG